MLTGIYLQLPILVSRERLNGRQLVQKLHVLSSENLRRLKRHWQHLAQVRLGLQGALYTARGVRSNAWG